MPRKDTRLKTSMIGLAVLCLLMVGDSISQSHRKTADLLDAQKEYEDARQYYQKSLIINPFNFNSMVKYAEISLRLNDLRGAEKYLDKALKLYPDLALANYLQSQIQFKKNNFFRSYYYAAVAYSKYKLEYRYKQWFEFMKRYLETLLHKNSKLHFPNDKQIPNLLAAKKRKVNEK